MKNAPLVSVNIRTYNSEKTLAQTLQSVRDQSYKKIEILISDGYSTDKSVEIAKKYSAKVSFADKLGDARIQNYLNSKGKYVLSLDSDQVLEKKVIEQCVELSEKKDIDALIITEKSFINKGTFLEKLMAYDKWVIDQDKEINVTFGTACPRFFKRDFLKKIKWPEQLAIFDDTILYVELLEKGAKVDYFSSSAILHNEVTNWNTLIKKFFRYGKGYRRSFAEKPTTIVAHSLPRKSYFTKAAFSNPQYFLGLLLLYFIKAAAAAAGVVSSFIEPQKKVP